MKLTTAVLLALITISPAWSQANRRGAPNHPASDSGPGVPLVKAFLAAYNKPDMAAIRKMIAADIVFLDDDGHTNLGNEFVEVAMERRLTGTVRETLAASGPITSSGTADVVWASFPYNYDRESIHRKGLITMVFRKTGTDWRIVHFQFAIDQIPANSLDRR